MNDNKERIKFFKEVFEPYIISNKENIDTFIAGHINTDNIMPLRITMHILRELDEMKPDFRSRVMNMLKMVEDPDKILNVFSYFFDDGSDYSYFAQLYDIDNQLFSQGDFDRVNNELYYDEDILSVNYENVIEGLRSANCKNVELLYQDEEGDKKIVGKLNFLEDKNGLDHKVKISSSPKIFKIISDEIAIYGIKDLRHDYYYFSCEDNDLGYYMADRYGITYGKKGLDYYIESTKKSIEDYDKTVKQRRIDLKLQKSESDHKID